MPELAEVEFYRRRWDVALRHRIERVFLHPRAGVFKTCSPALIESTLPGETLLSSEAAAKQMLFRFTGDAWLGVHLGMTGELTAQPAAFVPRKHDHLVLALRETTLVFSDPRMFGRIQFHLGPDAPAWWTTIAPAISSRAFSITAVSEFLRRRARTPIKAVLLMQERFPGVGNWMADEILWRAEIHPRRTAGSLSESEITALHHETRHVAKRALEIIGTTTAPNIPDPPKSWLFPHRWTDGGRCPKTGVLLKREDIGGRTTCWSPARQKL
ncbi:DNA-formamidopyrimidine glycosylase [Nibricoccus aquaticus]|uniref:DNA-formamidopyrimidine glycosylase n=1 Tax=Nibricoccus aquaticus TaxID=2576891 RepID=A0A290Q2E6_9BACT|nr:DNA-formamidopyrimidine glycosylase family protein [Nibricoccus aquaticus]ATC62819.1 DNA-formamidopyrimidine glycosylase [Nibricoccus aquaticus]